MKELASLLDTIIFAKKLAHHVFIGVVLEAFRLLHEYIHVHFTVEEGPSNVHVFYV